MNQYQELVAAAKESDKSIPTGIVNNSLWVQVVGGMKGGTIFGLGSQASDVSFDIVSSSRSTGFVESCSESCHATESHIIELEKEVASVRSTMDKINKYFEQQGSQTQVPMQFMAPTLPTNALEYPGYTLVLHQWCNQLFLRNVFLWIQVLLTMLVVQSVWQMDVLLVIVQLVAVGQIEDKYEV